jgi:hypothetical protein
MRTRLMISVLIITILFGLNVYLHQAVVPRRSSDLALQQLQEDGSREKLRAAEQLSNWIDMVLAFTGGVTLLTVWYVPLRKRLTIRRPTGR